MSTTAKLDRASPGSPKPDRRAITDPTALTRLLASHIVPWYRENGRSLPWRDRADDPYAVWVSEIMLQQTQVSTAIPYYLAWLERFPCVTTLAAASESSVLHSWQGLGYYGRARRMHAAASVLIARYGGVFPRDRGDLLGLPGVGPYTASAIRSVAFEIPDAAMDVNVTRVLARLCGVPSSAPETAVRRELKSALDAAMNGMSPREAVQAVMELGALLCHARTPNCSCCPVASICAASASDRPEDFGPRRARQSREMKTHIAVLVRQGERWLVERRPDGGQLGGLWQFPTRELLPGETEQDCARRTAMEAAGLEMIAGKLTKTIRHSITRYTITLRAFTVNVDPGRVIDDGKEMIRWAGLQELAMLPMPSAQSRIRAAMLADERGKVST